MVGMPFGNCLPLLQYLLTWARAPQYFWRWQIPIPVSLPPLTQTRLSLAVLCCRVTQWKMYDSVRNHPQLTPICAPIDGGSRRRERSSCLCSAFRRPCADGRAECFDFLSFGVEIVEEDGVIRTCGNITQYQKTKYDARYRLASHSTHTSALSGTLTQAEKANVFSSHDFPLMKLGQVSPLASHNHLLRFKTRLV